MIFSGGLATQESLDKALASINMASAPETAPFPPNKSKKSRRNRDSTNDTTSPPTSNNSCTPPVTRHLEFRQAMTDFKVMFPMMELATIETILRANNGAVDATIDQLLTLTAETPDAGTRPHTNRPPPLQESVQLSFSQPTPTGYSPPPMYRGPAREEQPPPYSPPSPNSPFSQVSRPAPKSLTTSTPDDAMFQEFMSTLQSTPPPSSHGNTNRSVSLDASPVASYRNRRRWNPPMLGQLPDNFLRISSYSSSSSTNKPSIVSSHLRQRLQQNVEQRSSIDKDDVEMQQMLHDERVALYMQNEEFMRELQHNPEFSAALERDVMEATREASIRNHRLSISHQTHAAQTNNPQTQIPIHHNVLNGGQPTEGAIGGAAGGGGDDVVFRNKLKHMGKSTKVKFAQMAKKFNSKKKKKSSRAGLDGQLAPSMANLLECEEDDENLLMRHRPKVEENIYADSRHI